MTSGDFNGDGKLDLALTADQDVLIALGNGDGTFQNASGYPTAQTPAFVAVSDFNHDGKLDLATANSNGTVSILLGNGDGTFQSHVDYPVDLMPQSISVTDFNGDGQLDLAVANHQSTVISVLLGNGDGTFQDQAQYQAGRSPTSLVAGDFNKDGKPDLVVADAQGGVSLLLGNGDGSFQNSLALLKSDAVSVVVADFNHDDKLDVAALAPGGNITVLLGRGDGTFLAPQLYSGGFASMSLGAGDFNGDGLLDLAIARGFSSEIAVLLGKADGTFLSPMKFSPTVFGSYLALGDFNNDGITDIAGGLSLLLGTTAVLSQDTLTFQKEVVGKTSKPQTVTFFNYGSSALAVSIAISTNFTQTNTCGSSVPARHSCVISISFAPTAQGLLTGTLTVADNAANNPQTVTLSGTGVQGSVLLNPTSLTFGSQQVGTTSPPQNVTLTNDGSGTLTITSIVASGDFAQTNTCGTTLLVGQDCTIVVTFTPTQTGTRTGAITITDDGTGGPQTVPLTGTGTD